MLSFATIDHATRSNYACIAWIRNLHTAVVRVTPREVWLALDTKTALHVRDKLKLGVDAHDRAVTYREIAELLAINGADITSRLLKAQLRGAAQPTHSHAPPNWKPSPPPTRLQLPAPWIEHNAQRFQNDNPQMRKKRREKEAAQK